MDAVNEYLKKHQKFEIVSFGRFPKVVKRAEFKDGFNISIQAHEYAYCTPRETAAWPYERVELGYPSEIDELIEEYSECPGTTETVYGYVPIDIVNKLAEKHGGFKE